MTLPHICAIAAIRAYRLVLLALALLTVLFFPQSLPAVEEQQEAAEENGLRTKKESVQVHIEGKLSEAQSTNIRNYLSFSKLDPALPLNEGMFAYYLEKAKKEAATALRSINFI